MNRTTVLLLFGGESSEHDVSIASARNVYAAIDDEKYDVLLGYIGKQGKWWLLDEWTDTPERHGGTQLLVAPGTGSLMTMPGSRVLHPHVILPILHGKNGEDGSIQGLAQLTHIPIVGCGILASALCMDKMRTKLLLENQVRVGIKTAAWILFSNAAQLQQELAIWTHTNEMGYSDLTERIGDGPWFVKPSRAGSSVGVSKVEKIEDMQAAIKRAFEHDDTVLVEEAIEGRELEVAVLGTPPYHEASGVGEIIPGDTFYTYDDKYASDSASQVKLDTDLPTALQDAIRERALKAYEVLGCEGLARIDFFLTPKLEIYLNEVNTLPGFTSVSMYPKLWRHQGLSYSQLVERLLSLAMDDTIQSELKEE
ncbi:MAG: D-alanine--D-alanine ligase family protein [Candidatus Saccharimonadales bacterium]